MITPINPVWFEEYSYGSDDLAECAEEVGCKLMQFTGLKDKNGKEIYESDIVESMGHKYLIQWMDGMFVSLLIPEKLFQFRKVNHACEVIGNEYENPELLNL